ncbi:MAG: glycosyltransferase family 39 protein [Anaerolineae bacterium]|nr:glycosyltransferase family 39 protein [Anaerolineae bacterium]
MADWFEPTITLLPLAAWMFLGVGVPWALALLPRDLWRERITVIAVGMALGPLGFTAWMFVLGTWGRITLAGTLAGSVIVAGVGAALALIRRRRQAPSPAPPTRERVSAVEWLLIIGIGLILLVNVLAAAYWPFLFYDTQWVYGYNGRIFTLQEAIPDEMGYYPQLVPLAYTAMQQAWGGINDHAARVIVPWFNVGMALMAYVLGRRVFGSRRVGLLTAGVWLLYPHVAAWYGTGDLEIPLTLYMTGAAVFFIDAWRTDDAQRAVLSGVLLAGALWTKPTGGALALGVILAVAGWGVITRLEWSRFWPKLRTALITGLACAPLGGMWYVRNLALGHEAVTFPADYWHDFAQRSGQEFGWPLLIAALAAGGLVWRWRRADAPFRRALLPLIALVILLIATLPSAVQFDVILKDDNLWRWLRGDLTFARRLEPPEYALIALGFSLLVWAGRGIWQGWHKTQRETVGLIWALALPYGVVWFWNFSYHYRLSFAIVPLMAVQVAALIDAWVWPWLAASRARRWIGTGLVAALMVPPLAAGLEHTVPHWRNGDLPDDTAKYDTGNPSLMTVVHMLEDYAAEHGQPVVAAPGEDRLPFFFPAWDIRNSREPGDLPTLPEDLAGVDVYIGGSVPTFLMRNAGVYPNPLLAHEAVAARYHALAVPAADGTRWPTVLQPIPLSPDGSLALDDGIYRYTAYTVHLDARETPMQPGARRDDEVIIGGFAQLIGHDVISLDWQRGSTMFLTLYWRPTGAAPASHDFCVYIHLLDTNGERVVGWDGAPLQGLYPTSYWTPGESLLDYWVLDITKELPPGPVSLRIGLYDPVTGERLPVVIDGAPAGDGLTIDTRITIR